MKARSVKAFELGYDPADPPEAVRLQREADARQRAKAGPPPALEHYRRLLAELEQGMLNTTTTTEGASE